VTDEWEELLCFEVPSQAGMERRVMDRVAETARGLLSPVAIERLKTAVSEGALNAIEHGNHFREDLLVEVIVLVSPRVLRVTITDQGGDQVLPEAPVPDIEAKLSGLETPRGWGLFLIRNMVDELQMTGDGQRHTLLLDFYRER